MKRGLVKRVAELEARTSEMKPRRGVNVRVKANRFGVATVAQPQSKTTAGTADTGIWV